MNIERSHRFSTSNDQYPTRVEGEEQSFPRRDPVLWSDWHEDAPVSREEAAQYRDNGYMIRKDMFSQDEIAKLVETSADLRRTGGGIREDHLVSEPGSGEVRTIFCLDQHSDVFARLAADARVAEVARFLVGDDVYLHQSRLNYKPGFTGKEFYWHSDFETWHAEDGLPRPRAVSASILLTDNSLLNGPLMLIPGSHKEFIACKGATPEDNHKSSLAKQEIGVPSQERLEALAEEAGIDAAAGPAGTVVFFECNTLHASNGNVTPHPRSNAFFVYNAVSNRPQAPFAAPKPRPAFLADRGDGAPIKPVHGNLLAA